MQPDIFTVRFTVHLGSALVRAQAPYMEVNVSEMEENSSAHCTLLYNYFWKHFFFSVGKKKHLFTCSLWYRQSLLPS